TEPAHADHHPLPLHDALPISNYPKSTSFAPQDLPLRPNTSRTSTILCSVWQTWRRRRTRESAPNDSIGYFTTLLCVQRKVANPRSEEHTSELQSRENLGCRRL